MHTKWMLSLMLLCLVANPGCGGDGNGNGNGEGKYEMYVNDELLGATQLTFLKGRCLARLTVKPKEDATRAVLVAFGEQVAEAIPLDGSAPASEPGHCSG